MSKKTFDSIWDAISDTPQEAENMKLRSALIIALSEHIRQLNLPQREVAKKFGLTQPRMSDLLTNKITKFSLDALVEIAAQAGLHVELRISNAA